MKKCRQDDNPAVAEKAFDFVMGQQVRPCGFACRHNFFKAPH